VHRLHAIDITTGNERSGSPKVIQASVAGTGSGAVNGQLTFDPMLANQRASLALVNGVIYVGFSSFCDSGNYHGWLLAYDAATLALAGTFNATPNGSQGGIWQAGAAPAFDGSGNPYIVTGNGSFDGSSNFAQSVVKFAPRTLARQDWFAPSNFTSLNNADWDLGSAGATFLPNSSLFVMGGKEGKLYLLNSASLGHEVSGDTQIPQSFAAVDPTARPTATHHIHNTVAAWQSPAGTNVYLSGENDYLRAFRFDGAHLATPAFAVSTVLPPQGMPGGMLSVSASGSAAGTGIVWSTTPRVGDANNAVVPGMLRAFNAENLNLLWESTSPADDTLMFAKFSPPIVANGKVYAASFSNMLSVYGLRPARPANLALGKTATSTAASCATTEGPEKSTNGSIILGNSDKWCSLTSGTKSLQIDLGSAQTVSSITVRHAGAGGEAPALNTKAFNLLTSADGTTFNTVATITNNVANASTHSFAPVSARYVRLDVITPTQTGDTAARIYEVEVYGGASKFEAEQLPALATSGDTLRVAIDGGYSGGQGSILEGNAANDFVTYALNVAEARSYNVRVALKAWNNRGTFQLDVNGQNVGSPVDAYAASPAFNQINLGSFTSSAPGTQAFRFKVTGKNAASAGDWLAIDYILLTPQ